MEIFPKLPLVSFSEFSILITRYGDCKLRDKKWRWHHQVEQA
jgi:hypothetical protein